MTGSKDAVMPGPLARWVIYQRERFPLAGHAPLVAAFSLSAVCYSSLLRHVTLLPRAATVIVAFVSALLFFLQLRIADEFKDAEEDARYRPYRPVPRGLIGLPSLRRLFILGAVVQLGLSLWLAPVLACWLLLTWAYLALMSREFFVGGWLRRHPFTYMWTHMLIMPLIDVYTSATDWVPARIPLPHSLLWFLIASFFNGMVIEVGRKIRAPEDEEEGVNTYSVVWGRPGAVVAWLIAMALTAACAVVAAERIHFLAPVAVMLGAGWLLALIVGWRFLHSPVTRRAKWFEAVSGAWTLLLYLGLGIIPFFLQR